MCGQIAIEVIRFFKTHKVDGVFTRTDFNLIAIVQWDWRMAINAEGSLMIGVNLDTYPGSFMQYNGSIDG